MANQEEEKKFKGGGLFGGFLSKGLNGMMQNQKNRVAQSLGLGSTVDTAYQSGQEHGEQLVGIDSATLGQERKGILEQMKSQMDNPSLRAKMSAISNDDRMRQMKAQQRISGMAGGGVAGQNFEAQKTGDLQTAGIEQQDKLAAQGAYREELGKATQGIQSQAVAKAGLKVASTKQSGGGGLLGTVICTELYMQEYYSREIIQKDMAYGVKIHRESPDTYYGYIFLAGPVVSLMQKSKFFTALVSIIALPWAHDMAGYNNPIGKKINQIAHPICNIVGKTLRFFKRRKYATL